MVFEADARQILDAKNLPHQAQYWDWPLFCNIKGSNIDHVTANLRCSLDNGVELLVFLENLHIRFCIQVVLVDSARFHEIYQTS
jgi:hypothetical protein